MDGTQPQHQTYPDPALPALKYVHRKRRRQSLTPMQAPSAARPQPAESPGGRWQQPAWQASAPSPVPAGHPVHPALQAHRAVPKSVPRNVRRQQTPRQKNGPGCRRQRPPPPARTPPGQRWIAGRMQPAGPQRGYVARTGGWPAWHGTWKTPLKKVVLGKHCQGARNTGPCGTTRTGRYSGLARVVGVFVPARQERSSGRVLRNGQPERMPQMQRRTRQRQRAFQPAPSRNLCQAR